MIGYLINHSDKVLGALYDHIFIVLITLAISIVIAFVMTVFAMYSTTIYVILINFFNIIYSIPSLALFAMLIPLTGLGKTTAIIVLVTYNQYLLLKNFVEGLNLVDSAVVEAAQGLGLTKLQILFKVRIPLSKKAIFTGIHLAVVSTIGITTIAATINAGGLGTILFDGLRTINTDKIILGTLLSAGLAIISNTLLNKIEDKIE